VSRLTLINAAGEEADARCADKAPVHAEHGYVKKIDAAMRIWPCGRWRKAASWQAIRIAVIRRSTAAEDSNADAAGCTAHEPMAIRKIQRS
jgi:hypothetical protein